MPTLYIAGVALTLTGEGVDAALGADAAPFLSPAPLPDGADPHLISRSVEIRVVDQWPVPRPDQLSADQPSEDLKFSETPADAQGSKAPSDAQICYWREDVRLDWQPGGLRGVAWMNGERAEIWAVVQLALSAALLQHGGGLIHASAGVIDGAGWLCPGPSGTGKSTIARGAGFDAVLADEIVAVRPGEGGYTLWGTPFWSQGRALPLQNGGAPLAVLARPIQATAVSLGPLPEDEAAAWLLRCVTLYDDAPASRAAAFGLACDLVGRVDPIWLRFPKEGPWLPAALKAYRQTSSSRPTI